MQLILSDNSSFAIDIEQNPVWNELKRGYKHLQNVPIQFYPWDNQLSIDQSNITKLVEYIAEYAKQLDIDVNLSLCKKRDQYYLNRLHEIFEKNYDGKREWLAFHEHIHLLEENIEGKKGKELRVNWRDLAGLLEKDFQYNLIEQGTTKVYKGDVFVRWQELGKSPYDYWNNREPDNINRICELCKPWLILKHDFSVALNDIDFTTKSDSFDNWWNQYHNDFCKYYSIPNWNLQHMNSVLVFGNLQDISNLNLKLLQNVVPNRIKIG